MTAEWTPPRTWHVDDLVSADDLNEELRDNLIVLKDPPTAEYTLNEASDYTTSSTSFVDVDATNLALTIETAGGDVLVSFGGAIWRASGSSDFAVFLDVAVDGVQSAGDDGMIVGSSGTREISFNRLIKGLAAGEHTFKLQWKKSSAVSGSVGLAAGAGTTDKDIHSQFWAREVS